MKTIGKPLDSDIFIYKNPRRVYFKHRKGLMKNTFANHFFNSFGIALLFSIPFVIPSMITKELFWSLFYGFTFVFLWIQFYIVDILSWKFKSISELMPIITWVAEFQYFRRLFRTLQQKRIFVKEVYAKKLSIPIPNYFMFLNYKLTGDYSDYKRIAVRKIHGTWYFELILTKIAQKGNIRIWLK